MGTLLAAPFGIALLAAVAAPALIVGIPAYVGHRVSVSLRIEIVKDCVY